MIDLSKYFKLKLLMQTNHESKILIYGFNDKERFKRTPKSSSIILERTKNGLDGYIINDSITLLYAAEFLFSFSNHNFDAFPYIDLFLINKSEILRFGPSLSFLGDFGKDWYLSEGKIIKYRAIRDVAPILVSYKDKKNQCLLELAK